MRGSPWLPCRAVPPRTRPHHSLFVAERAGAPRLKPPLDAVQVEDVAAGAPGDAQPRMVRVACRVVPGSGHTWWERCAAGAGQAGRQAGRGGVLHLGDSACRARSTARPAHAWERLCGRTPARPASTPSLPPLHTRTRGIGLVLYAGLVQVVSADGARVSADGPAPHGHGVPLLDLKPLACTGGRAVPDSPVEERGVEVRRGARRREACRLLQPAWRCRRALCSCPWQRPAPATEAHCPAAPAALPIAAALAPSAPPRPQAGICPASGPRHAPAAAPTALALALLLLLLLLPRLHLRGPMIGGQRRRGQPSAPARALIAAPAGPTSMSSVLLSAILPAGAAVGLGVGPLLITPPVGWVAGVVAFLRAGRPKGGGLGNS